MRVKRKSFLESFTYLFLFLFPILPNYFKILGYDSGSILCIIFCLVYLLSRGLKGLRNSKTLLLFVLLGLVFSLESLYHGEISRFVVSLFQRVLLLACLFDFFTKQDRKFENFFKPLLYAACLLGIIGIIEFFTKYNIFGFLYNGSQYDMSPELQIRGSFARIETTFGHAITYSIYCSFIGLLCYPLWRNHPRKKIYIRAYAIMVINLIMTVSRAPIIIFVFTNILLVLLLGYKEIRRYVRYVFFIILGVLLLSLLFPNTIGGGITQIFNIVAAIFSKRATSNVSALESTETPFTYRLGLLALIPQFLKEGNYLFGIGASRANSYTFFVNGYSANSIDNSYLNTILRYGLVGVFSLYTPLFYSIFASIKKYRKTKAFFYITIACMLIMYALNIASVAQMTEEKLYYVILALFLAYDYRKTKGLS